MDEGISRRAFLARLAVAGAAVTPAGALLQPIAAQPAAARLRGSLDVKDYGAVGDGLADDTGAIQGALDAARTAGGGNVRVPPGAYRVTADLVVGSRTVVFGAGGATSVIVRDPTPAAVAVIRNHDITPTGMDSDITFEDLAVERQGECSKANEPYDNAIQLRYVTRAVVRDCRLQGGGKSVLFDACSRWKVVRTHLEGFVDNGFVSAGYEGRRHQHGHGLFADNQIGSPAQSGFTLGSSGVLTTQGSCEFLRNTFFDQATNAFEMGETEKLLIADNVALWSGKAGVHNDFLVGDCDDVDVVDNRIEMGGINISYYDVVTDVNDRIHVSRNHLTSGEITLNSCRSAAVLHNTVERGLIALNSVEDAFVNRNEVSRANSCSYWVLSNSAAPLRSGRIHLSNNAGLEGNRSGDPSPSAAGFVIDGGDHVYLIRNVVADAARTPRQRYGLFVNATTNLADVGNDFEDVRTAQRAPSGGGNTYAGFNVPLSETFPQLRGTWALP